MKKYYFFFIFKFRFRRAAFNNFLKLKKIKNYKIIDLSGPFKYYLLSKILIMIVQIFPKRFRFTTGQFFLGLKYLPHTCGIGPKAKCEFHINGR